MLGALRSTLNTWVAKAFFLLLVASFAVWGIGDIFQGRSLDQAAARVGDARISIGEAQDAYRRDLGQLTRNLGPTFQPNETIRRSVAESALSRLIASRAVEAEAERLGIAVSEAALRETIFAIAAFRGPDGQFSRPLFDSFLRQNGLTEARLLQGLSTDLLRAQLLGAAVSGAVPPAPMVELVRAFREERRSAAYVVLQTLDVAPPPPPPEADLRRYHELNPDQFTTAERRVLSVASLTLDDVARDVPVADADIAQAYEARRTEFTTAAARDLDQVLVQDEAAARAIAERIGAGTPPAEAAAAVPGAEHVALGWTAREDLPFPELMTAVFEAFIPGVVGPIRSPFGWHVVQAKASRDELVRPLADVADELRLQLARDRAADRLYERLNRIEDDLAAGQPLPSIAERQAMRLQTLGPVDRNGRDAQGEPAELGAQANRVLEAGFAIAPGGGPNRPIEAEDGSILLIGVERVDPPVVRPFEEVEAEVLAAWQTAERRRIQEERAARILAAAGNAVEGFEAAVRAEGLVPQRSAPAARQGRAPAEAGPVLLERLFAMKLGEATMIETPQGFVVAALATVEAGDPAESGAQSSRTQEQIRAAMAGELEQLYVAALQRREGVSMNQQVIDDLARP